MNRKACNLVKAFCMVFSINVFADQAANEQTLKKSGNGQKEANVHCNDVMNSFMNERSYLSKPILINASKYESSYYCLIQYTKDNVNYSSPINIQITYNPKTGSYKYKPM